MLSTVETSFSPSIVGEIEKSSSSYYDSVLGFDYNWLQSINQSGAQLASFLNDLGDCKITSLDIEAHSEGVPVSMAAIGQSVTKVSHLISLGGPIMGTPAADDTSVLETIILDWNGLDLPNGISDLTSVLVSPFVSDLTTSSTTLSVIRSGLTAKSENNAPQIIVTGGDKPVVEGVGDGILSPFMGTNFDGVVPWTSSLAFGSRLKVYPLVDPLQLFKSLGHTDLVSNSNVQTLIGDQLADGPATAPPSLLCASSGQNCEGAQQTTFTFSGQGFGSEATNVAVFDQDSSGSVTQQTLSLQDNAGNISWSSTPACSDPTGSFSVFSFDVSENLTSNNVMQTIDQGNCSGTFTLTVASSDPTTGAAVAVSPADNNGQSGGRTQFALTYNNGTAVTLTASATAGGNNFSSWMGCDAASGMTCTLTMNANRTITASYAPPALTSYTLSVASTDPNSGVAIGANPTDNNGQSNGTTQFTLVYNSGSVVTLSAPSSASGDDFSNWTGCDSVSGMTCTVTMSVDRTVTANYLPPGTTTLTVDSSNPTSGVTITVSPADNNSQSGGATPLTLSYNSGTAVSLTAPSTGGTNNFSSWSGCDTVTGSTCTVTMNSSRTVTANYGPTPGFAYVANQNSGDVSAYSVDTTTGALTSLGTFTSGLAPASVAADPAGPCLYVANSQDSVTPISVFVINQSTGALTPGPAPPMSLSGIDPMSIAVHPTGKFAYVANYSGSVSAFSIDSSTCALTEISGSPFPAGTLAQAVAIDLSGKSLYVANLGDDTLSAYSIDSVTGVLTPIIGSPYVTGSSPTSVAVDPSGKFVFATNSFDGTISVFSRDTTSGTLTSIGLVATDGAPFSVAVDPTDKFVFVAWLGSPGAVEAFTLDTITGALTTIGDFATGNSPESVAVDPSGKFVYAANNGSTSVSAFQIDPNTGALTPVLPVGYFPAGGGPVSVAITAASTTQ